MPKHLLVKIFFSISLIGVPAYTYAGTLLSDIDLCIKTVSKEQGKKNSRLKAELDFYCPGLTKKVNRSSLARNLSWRFDSTSSISELRDLRHYLAYSQAKTSQRYRFQDVTPIVAEIYKQETEAPPGLWDRFIKWLDQYLPQLDKEDREKIDRFFESIKMPKWVNDAIFYGSGVLILVIAFWVLFREWRYYRRVGAYRELAGGSGVADVPGREGELVALDAMPGLPLHRRVPALLRWAIHHFETRGELPSNHSLTNRELARILAREHNRNSNYFAELVGESERVVYGNALPPEDRVDALLDGAKQLESSAGTS